MKITKMRTKSGEIPSTDLVLKLEREIRTKLSKAGFITDVDVITRSSIKIGQHMRSFSLDLNIHDRNLYRSPAGDKLTNLPTWDQRVEFNDILNGVLNKYAISANVKSGPYTIRLGKKAMTESDWSNQMPDWVRDNMAHGYYIESIDEREYIDERRLERNRMARERRARLQSQKDAEFKANLDSITMADVIQFRSRKAGV